MKTRNSESGNAFLFILIGVVLFAALAITMSRGMRSQTTTTMTERDAMLAAADINNYAQKLQRAIDRLRRRNCSENEISFENPAVAGYTNASAPGDNSCHVFELAGGSVGWQNAPKSWLDTSYAGSTHYGQWLFSGRNQVGDYAGCANGLTTCSELIATVFYIKREACIAINDKLGITNPSGEPPGESSGPPYDNKFTGSFTSSNELTENAAQLSGQFTACFKETGVAVDPPTIGSYAFFHTLIER